MRNVDLQATLRAYVRQYIKAHGRQWLTARAKINRSNLIEALDGARPVPITWAVQIGEAEGKTLADVLHDLEGIALRLSYEAAQPTAASVPAEWGGGIGAPDVVEELKQRPVDDKTAAEIVPQRPRRRK